MGGHDGIAWREWGEEAFAEAKRENKPVLLDIGAVWCHWCHVMDDGIPGDPVHTGTYANLDIQKRIAENYVPIKVDNDRRPDINARYNMGGWPTTAFLTPDGDILYGETYVHPARMISLLDHIAEIFRNQRGHLEEQTQDMRRRRAQAEARETPPADLDPETAQAVAESIVRNFDPEYGGFGQQPKFPHPDSLLFALERYSRTGDERLKTFLEKTMAGMDSGGMYDRYAGGFFRYSTTRDWSIPHYEKMLEDNARLTEAYATASVVLDDARYLSTVRSAHGWLLTAMYDAQTGAFAGSQDADAEERYYGEPLDVRATLPTPYIDRTVYVNWNALMVSALVRRFQITGDDEILHIARRTHRFLWDNLSASDTGRGIAFSHYWTGGSAAGSAGLLMDQTAMLGAAIDLYEATGDPEYRAGAVQISGHLLGVLQDSENGGFYDLTPAERSIGELASPRKDMKENAEAAYLLLKLAQITESAAYREAALRALRAFTGEYRNVGYFASAYARAVDAALRTPLHIAIAGDLQPDTAKALLRIAWKAVWPGKTVEPLASGVDDGRGFTPGPRGEARAFVCVGETCLAPASTPEELRARLYAALSGE